MDFATMTVRWLAVGLLFLGLACGGGGASNPISPAPPATPAAPSNLLATGAVQSVSLTWSASSGATGYNVKRGVHGGPYTKLASTAATSYTDTGLSNGVTYYYVVAASNNAGEGRDSSEASATPSTEVAPLPAEDATRNHIGLNTWFLNDWDGSSAFVDVAKQGRPWENASWNAAAPTDDLGWPTTDASTVFWTGTPIQVNGTYKLSFKGQADVALMWYGGSVANTAYNAATNTTTADVTVQFTGANGSGGLKLTNTRRTAASATNTGFSELHLYRPGYATDGSAVFTSSFLAGLGKATVVRMMDWTATNQNLIQHWSQRQTPLHFYKPGETYTGPSGGVWSAGGNQTGVALEHQIQLCNVLKADFWVNIPVVADDDYVRKVALAIRYGTDGTNPYTSYQANPVYPPLDPAVRVYVEYANEIWNFAGGFDCFGVIHDIVKALPAGHALNTPSGAGEYQLLYRYPAWRMAAISDIFRAVYGDASMMNRVRPLVMTQQGNANDTLALALNWLDVYAKAQTPARTVASYLYGAGGSAYYGVNSEPSNHADLDGYFAAGNYPDTGAVTRFGVDGVWASNFGLKRIAYEGGPGLDNYTDAEARTINADARMQDMVVKTHDAWSQAGGDLLIYYTLTGPPSWEFTPDITTTNTPKLKALDQLKNQARAAVTLGQALPGTIIAADWHGSYQIRTGYDYTTTIGTLPAVGGNDAGEWVAYPGHAGAAFSGTLKLQGRASSGATVAVWVNGVKQGEVTLPAGISMADSTSLAVSLPAGLVVIRLETVGANGYDLYSIAVN